jgi:hypothetical protein
MEIRASINNDLNSFTSEMLQLVADYVKSLRLKQAKQKMEITPLVASMFTGHKTNLSDEELDQLKEDYLKEKYL